MCFQFDFLIKYLGPIDTQIPASHDSSSMVVPTQAGVEALLISTFAFDSLDTWEIRADRADSHSLP